MVIGKWNHERRGPCYAWSCWAIFRPQLILAATSKEYTEARITITWFYIVSISMLPLKIVKGWLKLVSTMTFIIFQNKRSIGRVAPGWVHWVSQQCQVGTRPFYLSTLPMKSCWLVPLLKVLRQFLQFQGLYKDGNIKRQKCFLLCINFIQKHPPSQRLLSTLIGQNHITNSCLNQLLEG